MDDQGREVVLTFLSHYDAIKAKREIDSGKLVPVPRAISSSCGTALKCTLSDYLNHKSVKKEEAYIREEEKWSVLHL